MKILCISDQVDPLVYSKYSKESYKDVDLVISAGDLPLKFYGYIISTLNKDLLFVFGNHNLERLGQFVSDGRSFLPGYAQGPAGVIPEYNGECLEGKIIYDKKHDLIIGGLGGCKRYNRGRHQFTEKEMRRRILRMLPRLYWNKLVHGRYIDILVTHAAPFGIHDEKDPCHEGFRVLLDFMHRFRPSYLLHGHIHLTDFNTPRVDSFEGTKVINVFQKYVLDDENLGGKKL